MICRSSMPHTLCPLIDGRSSVLFLFSSPDAFFLSLLPSESRAGDVTHTRTYSIMPLVGFFVFTLSPSLSVALSLFF